MRNDTKQQNSSSQFLKTDGGKTKSNAIEIPSITLPKGGGAIKGIDEKFSVNAINGTSSLSIPLPFSAARGASPALSLSYSSGAGNSIFGLGWNLSLSSIKRKTDKGLPVYNDADDSDTFLFSEAEDLVPVFKKESDGSFSKNANGDYVIHEKDSSDTLFTIRHYRPRVEGLFARIERWTEKTTHIQKWRVITKENVTTLFGWSEQSVIADPGDSQKIYQWLPEFVFDDKGNCSQYVYAKENAIGFDISLLHNKNRFANGDITYTNRYLQKVLYGNKTPYKKFGDAFPVETDYLFQTVLDYGEYDTISPYAKINEWRFRADAFSDYKAGFEIRTTRLCKRVLLFHYFDELPGGSALVKSLNIEYDTTAEQDFTFLRAMSVFGYIKKTDGSYSSKKLPSVEFGYQKHDWSKEVKTISIENLTQTPSGLDDKLYQFTDLFNEGLSGILTEQEGGWYYKHNLGNGNFNQAQCVSPKPSFSGLGSSLNLMDLDADGGKQLVSYDAEPQGYFELNGDESWAPWRNFSTLPNVDFKDANTRMIDLNGDGKPELLISEDFVFTWYPSAGKNGFLPANRTAKPFDEEEGPHMVFADAKQTIYLADMSGDGLTDIVRIRNGEVCYWPNLGYGRFGTKVAMDNVPVFDRSDAFNPGYLRLADIDGSGTPDIVYLGKNKFTCWKNLSGNQFSTTPFEIDPFPGINQDTTITVTDLLGNGVSCIVWSSALPGDRGHALRYVDLMNSKKPHVLVSYKNNLGKEVNLEYTPSTKFYLEDKQAGTPWITKLHFPVHCVSRTETIDRISGHRFVSSYQYHHGYYDHAEREFRGFAMVEQIDAEHFEHWTKSGATNIVEAPLHQEPVVSRTWYHTGAFMGRERILNQFEQEYWYAEMNRQGYAVTHPEVALPPARLIPSPGMDPALVDNLTSQEWTEALRACKSMSLRAEVFAKDAAAFGNTEEAKRKELIPYSVATHNCMIELLQPKGKNKFAVFIVKESESITYSYERNPDDARVAHNLNIKLDAYGNVLESASVVYPRFVPDTSLPGETQQEQRKTVVLYTQNQFTNDVLGDDVHRLRLPSEVKTFELKGVSKAKPFYAIEDFSTVLSTAQEIQYHQTDTTPPAGQTQKRLIEHIRTVYYRNNLTGVLPIHQLESLGIPYERYQLAYTLELLYDIFGTRVDAAMMSEGRFTHSEADSHWWVSSGTTQFISGSETPVDAQSRFYSPVSYIDPFGARSTVKYYGNYYLFIEETEDALGNRTRVDLFNFRTFQPQRMMDMNGNLSETLTDELGLVKAVALFGKGDEADNLTGLSEATDATETTSIHNFLSASDDSSQMIAYANDLLRNATARFVCDLEVYTNTGKPVVVSSIMREQHASQNANSALQLSFEYSGGMGDVLMKKVQAEPGIAKQITVQDDNSILVSEVDTASLNPKRLRWIGNGRTIVNNKGNAVKEYEPYFSLTHQYEDFRELTESGVTSLKYYDAPGRLIRTELPDGTFLKTTFDSWKQTVWDANDTVLESSWYTNRINRLLDAHFIADGKDPIREREAAEQSAMHANTPHVMHFDTLGRSILSVDHNRDILTNTDDYYNTRVKLDIEGNLKKVTDARNNMVVSYKYDMLGNLVSESGMDSGQRWRLMNTLGDPLRTWDERGHIFQYAYDILHRPAFSKIMGGDGATSLDHIVDRIIYGESLLLPDRSNASDIQEKNLLGNAIKHYDTGGLINTPAYNFKGQPILTTRKIFRKFKEIANWTDANLESDLEPDEFTFSSETDAMGRIIRQVAPDESVITPSYNEAGLLNSETVLHPGDGAPTAYVKNIDYNEKRRRSKIVYGNDVITKFDYDYETFRLKRLETKRKNNDLLQDLHYTYDPKGNVTHVEDRSIPVTFFNNQKNAGVFRYTYDALYRLTEATGRENNVTQHFDSKDNWNDATYISQINTGDPMATRNYTQKYKYDAVGNILQMRHTASGHSWTRNYMYEIVNNRLQSTALGSQTYNYVHHAKHGYMTMLPHLTDVGWNFKEEIVKSIRQRRTDGGSPETTYYQYDAKGQRIRKITESEADAGATAVLKDERIYISGYELYRSHSGATVGLERTSLSLIDEGHRFVMIDTETEPRRVLGIPLGRTAPEQTIRYQLFNHLGSSTAELDEHAAIISYEEYHPFGTTAYQAKNAAIDAAAKRYRYTGMERDEETGLNYHTARYYIPWLGRWLNCDPIGIKDGINLYAYAGNTPVNKNDKGGKQASSVSGADRITQAIEAADRANFDDDSVNHALDVIDDEISSRGFSYYFTRDAVMAHNLLRAQAYARHAEMGNYGRAAFHGTLGVIDSFGYTLYGDTPAETGRNFAISLVIGAAFSRLAMASRAAQLESQAATEALAARVASRRAAPIVDAVPPPEVPVTPTTPIPPEPVTPTSTTPVSTPPRTGGATTTAASPPRLVTSGRRDFFAMSDSSNPRFQATGALTEDGVLTITMRTILNGVRSTVLRGSEAYQTIVRHFGSAVRAIKGSWSYGDNLAAFNELTARGVSPEAAALRTWSGQQASSLGFGRVSVTSLEGTAGNYTKVEVLFTPGTP